MEQWKLNLYTLWVTQVIALMSFGFGLPFLPFYMQELGVTDPVQLNFYTGLASTIPAATMTVAAPIWGMMADRYGRKLMLMRAMLAAVVIIGGMGLVSSVFQLMVLRALQGIFTGTITASMAFVSANTPENRMSYALGFMTSSNFIGYSIGPMLGGLMAEGLGYRICFLAGGALMAVGVVLVGLLVKEDKNTYGPRIVQKPVLPEREKSHEIESIDDETMMSAGQNIPKMSSSRRASSGKLLTPLIIMLLVMLFMNRMARIIFSPYIPIFVQENLHGISGAAVYTGLINGVIGIASALAAVTLARLGDRYEKRRIVTILTIASLPVAVLLTVPSPLPVFMVLFGLFAFILGGVEPILTSSASEHTSPEKRGLLFGFIGAVGNGAFMAAPLIGAAIAVNINVSAILVCIPVFLLFQLVITYRESRAERAGD